MLAVINYEEMKDNKINRFICKYATAKEWVFNGWFIGTYFNFRNPFVGISIGLTTFSIDILFLNITIATTIGD